AKPHLTNSAKRRQKHEFVLLAPFVLFALRPGYPRAATLGEGNYALDDIRHSVHLMVDRRGLVVHARRIYSPAADTGSGRACCSVDYRTAAVVINADSRKHKAVRSMSRGTT